MATPAEAKGSIEQHTLTSVEAAEIPQHHPYVVSADIERLLGPWAQVRGLTLPPSEFFDGIRHDFIGHMQDLFPAFRMVAEWEMMNSIHRNVQESGAVPISLDGVYHDTELNLALCRHVHHDGTPLGQHPRPGAKPVEEQYETVFSHLSDQEIQEVTLVDDVLFEGNLLAEVADRFAEQGIVVKDVCVGIAIGQGTDVLSDRGIAVRTDWHFPRVVDEVCERDFYPGVPYSGKTVLGEPDMGEPYLLPIGRPVEWASIPESSAQSFSRFCLKNAARLYDAIGDVSGRDVTCHDIDRTFPGLEKSGVRFSTALRRLAESL